MAVDRLNLSRAAKAVHGPVRLTGSKSESNRALVIRALHGEAVRIENLSEAADTVTLARALASVSASAQGGQPVVIDIGPAGTAMRFLSAFLSVTPGNYTLTGSKRMQERPIGVLVDALRQLGAQISYATNEGYPPLVIAGGFDQQKDTVEIRGDVSSQYLSALLLMAASLPQGLELHIDGELTSRPYVTMTLDMLAEAGIAHTWTGNRIRIAQQTATPCTLYVEPDWSAASYWYSIVALSETGSSLFLPGLRAKSLQGDKAIAGIMQHLGVSTVFEPDGIRLTKTGILSDTTHFDFTECPDLAQTVVVCAAALQHDLSFSGLHTLRIKETDRIAALQNELAKFNVQLLEMENEVFQLRSAGLTEPKQLVIDTYEDHRMAMAFAPLALVFNTVGIAEPNVVEKSYPDFWNHLKEQGFIIT